jgi:dynein heavy chain 1, cytosolic
LLLYFLKVDRVSQEYNKLATACSYIYMMLHQLDEIHLLYNYSLDFLLDIFTNALKSPRLSGVKDHHTRLSIILQDLFSVFFYLSRYLFILANLFACLSWHDAR